jgi:hypothetical protein
VYVRCTSRRETESGDGEDSGFRTASRTAHRARRTASFCGLGISAPSGPWRRRLQHCLARETCVRRNHEHCRVWMIVHACRESRVVIARYRCERRKRGSPSMSRLSCCNLE